MNIALQYLMWLLISSTVFARCPRKPAQKRIELIIQKLIKLGEILPDRCRSEAETLTFQCPRTQTKKTSSLLVLETSFRLTYELLMKNTTHTGWDSVELRQLRELLGQQSQDYTSCLTKFPSVTSDNTEDIKKWTACWTGLGDFLTTKNFSSCAWEIARPFIQQWMNTMKTLNRYRP